MVMLLAPANTAARAEPSIQRCDSLFVVARERRDVTLPLSRFQTLASMSPNSSPVVATTAKTTCSKSPRRAPPLPIGPYPFARALRPPKESSLVSWITRTSRPAARAAVPAAAWVAISCGVTASFRKNRVNCISPRRLPPSLLIQELGLSTSAACNLAPLFEGGGRHTAHHLI